jgi:curved DNA-binding protein CbpA
MSGDANPFGVLGLPARTDLTDDDVRAAWRRLAAATHPDRPDGGDPDRFAAAAAAYTALRTRSGRGEALADLTAPTPPLRRSRSRRSATSDPGPPPAATRALPDATGPAPAARGPAPGPWAAPGRRGLASRGAAGQSWLWAVGLVSQIRRGRPARLLLRLAIAAAVCAGAVAVAGFQPATPALIVGTVTWLLLTAPRDLAPPR